MTTYLTTDTDLTAVASAIRTKGGTSAALSWPSGFVSAVQAIPTGGGGVVNTCTMEIGFIDRLYVICSNFSAGIPSGTYVAIARCDDYSYSASESCAVIFVGCAGETILDSDSNTANTALYFNEPHTTGPEGYVISDRAFGSVSGDYGGGESEATDIMADNFNFLFGTYTATVFEL